MAKWQGGAKLDKILERIAANARNVKVQIGFMEDAKYPDGTGVAFVAAMNEWGSCSYFAHQAVAKALGQKTGFTADVVRRQGRPPRPFFRGMIQAKHKEWPAAVAGLLKANSYNVSVSLKITGEAIQGQLEEAIQQYVGPELAPETIAKKGFSKQLIDTSLMWKSVTSRVVE